ncbi:hypothetical protein ACFFX0_13720 [Citricoccus parietis]|uniref:Uncharacterized protein n=1 Tax=Citricoccus parietis TaxID=592307 RepID=A0ABV5FZU5_9MICC
MQRDDQAGQAQHDHQESRPHAVRTGLGGHAGGICSVHVRESTAAPGQDAVREDPESHPEKHPERGRLTAPQGPVTLGP